MQTNDYAQTPLAIESHSELLTDRGRRFCLGREIASGGEARIYEIADDDQVVCKIYHSDKLNGDRERKLRAMAANKPDSKNVCWPLALVNDSTGKLRGFVMEKVEGEPLSSGIMNPGEFMKKNPNWTRRQSVRLVLNILEEFSGLHKKGILMGDVNDLNILMRPDATVSFVDCDSYQIQGFSCPVGTDAYTPPELQGVEFRNQVRELNHEAFSIAVLLFKIMLPGKHPFSHSRGGSLTENIRQGMFPYRIKGRTSSCDLPAGHWRFCWSHLPLALKNEFGAAFLQETSRPTVAKWIRRFRDYEMILNNPDSVFSGDSRQIGCDLSILPKNYAYWKPEQIRDLEKTDYDFHMEKCARRLSTPQGTENQFTTWDAIPLPAKASVPTTSQSSAQKPNFIMTRNSAPTLAESLRSFKSGFLSVFSSILP